MCGNLRRSCHGSFGSGSSGVPGGSSTVVGVVRVLPDHGAAHAKTHAHGGDPVADRWVFLELAGQLDHQPDAGGRQGVAYGDGPAVAVNPGVVVGDAVVVQETEDLDGEGLVDFEQANVIDGQSGIPQGFFGG